MFEYILMETIQTLPDNVDKAYENILEKSPKAKKPILIKVLHIMLALHLAAIEGHVEIIELFLAAGADVNTESDEGTALHLAASQGNLEVVKLLLNAEADANIQGNMKRTVFSRAVEKGHSEAVKLSLAAKADVKVQDLWKEAPLYRAVEEGHAEIVKLLVTAGAEVNLKSDGGTAMHIAKEHDHIEIVETLLATNL